MPAITATIFSASIQRCAVAVDDDLIGLRPVVVGDQPDGDQDVLEGASLIEAVHLQVAVGVARHFAGAELLDDRFHLHAAGFRGLAEVDLVALDRPAADEGRVIGLEVGEGGKGLHLPEQVQMDAHRAGHGVVIEEMGEAARAVLPAGVAHLAGLGFPVGVGVALRFIIVVAGLRGPFRIGVRVEGPVGQVDAVQRVGEGGAL